MLWTDPPPIGQWARLGGSEGRVQAAPFPSNELKVTFDLRHVVRAADEGYLSRQDYALLFERTA